MVVYSAHKRGKWRGRILIPPLETRRYCDPSPGLQLRRRSNSCCSGGTGNGYDARRSTLRTTTLIVTRPGSSQEAAHRVTARINRRIGRPDLNNSISKDRIPNQQNNNNNNVIKSNGGGTGYLNLRQRPASPSHRILR